jgi:hypothetical protein
MNVNVRKFLPRELEEYDPAWTNFINKTQSIVNYYKDKIVGIKEMFSPEKTQVARQVGQLMGAYISRTDTIREVKDKVGKAFFVHKNLSVFDRSIKPLLDSIMGEDTEIVNGNFFYGIFTSDVSEVDSPSLIEAINPTAVPKPKGVVYINIKRVPTQGEINKIIDNIFPMLPAYFNVLFGVATITSGEPFTTDVSLADSLNLVDSASIPYIIFEPYLQY